MTNAQHDPWNPELLAGYIDGELDSADRAAVEARVAANADARAELIAQQALARSNTSYWQKVAAPVPSASAWQRVQASVIEALTPATPSYRAPDTGEFAAQPAKRAWLRWSLSVAAMAALVFVGVHFWPVGELPVGHGLFAASDEAFEVAKSEDVDIIGFQGDDFGIIVVGLPPLSGPIELATFGEVSFDAIALDPDGRSVKPNVVATDPKRPVIYDSNKAVPTP